MTSLTPCVSNHRSIYRRRYPRSLRHRISAKERPNKPDPRERYLDNAALDFAQGIEAGLSPDEIVRIQLGIDDRDEISDVQRRYKDKVIDKLKQRAERLKKERQECLLFEAGKVAYGRGAYPKSCELLEQAALEHSEGTMLGGDIRQWLALSYQAMGRTEECRTLFKRLEKTHPNKKTRQQARDLLYIIDAPKLKLSDDEKVQLPVLKNVDRAPVKTPYWRSRSKPAMSERRKREMTFEESFWANYKPPSFQIPNRYVWVASIIICICLAVYSTRYSR